MPWDFNIYKVPRALLRNLGILSSALPLATSCVIVMNESVNQIFTQLKSSSKLWSVLTQLLPFISNIPVNLQSIPKKDLQGFCP